MVYHLKKICLTLNKLDRGGAEMRILKLLNDLERLNVKAEFYLFIMSGEQGTLTSDYLKNAKIKIIYGKKGLKGLNDFSKKIKLLNPDILHLNASMAAGIYAMIAKINGIEKIYSHLRTSEHYGSGFLYHSKQKIFSILMNIFSEKIIGVCDGVRKISDTPLEKWQTIYNGIEVSSKEINNDFEKYSLINLGRQNVAKNQVFLVDVIEELVKLDKDIPWKLNFYGRSDSQIEKNILNRVREKKLEKYINLCGETMEPNKILSQHHLLLLPSVREGLPGVVLEALGQGVQSIVSDLPGCNEISEKIPYVHVVNNFNAKDWAEKIYTVCMQTNPDKILIREVLENSCFNNKNHIENMRKLWNI